MIKGTIRVYRAGGTPALQRGSIMLIAIAVVLILSSLLLVFMREMRVEAQAAANRAEALQSTGLVRGGMAYAVNHLTGNQDPISLDTEMSSEAATLGDGYFWLIRPDVTDERKYDFGLIDEASKLNINTATYDMLMRLPNMTTDLAASIIDWRDADETVSENGGGENEFYLLQPEPYYCKNAPFETLEELLLVKGATRELLYGVDANHNGVVDESEENTGTSGGVQGYNGNARCGIMKYLTCYSIEANTDANGKPLVNVNQNLAQAIVRLFATTVNADRLAQLIDKARQPRPFRSIFDFYFTMGLTPDEFKKIAGKITTDPAPTIQGRININTAPKEVLRCLPGLEDGDADALVARRTSSGTDLTNIAWVIDTLPQSKVVPIGNYITSKTKRFSADIVGVGAGGRGFKRMRVIYDLRGSAPKMIYSKDLTSLGWPLDPGILTDLRAGKALRQAAARAR